MNQKNCLKLVRSKWQKMIVNMIFNVKSQWKVIKKKTVISSKVNETFKTFQNTRQKKVHLEWTHRSVEVAESGRSDLASRESESGASVFFFFFFFFSVQLSLQHMCFCVWWLWTFFMFQIWDVFFCFWLMIQMRLQMAPNHQPEYILYVIKNILWQSWRSMSSKTIEPRRVAFSFLQITAFR